MANNVTSTTVTAETTDSNATTVVKLDGTEDTDGTVALAVGANTITVEVTAEDTSTVKTYTVTVTRAAATSSSTFVSNIGQDVETDGLLVGPDSGSLHLTRAQQFTTGDNNNGYTLSEVVIKVLSGADDTDVLRVSIHASISAITPGSSLYTFTNPAPFSNGNMTFAAPADAILTKETDYYVVVEATSGAFTLSKTSSPDEGTAPDGESIANAVSFKPNLNSALWSATSNTSLLLRIKGTRGGVTTTTSTDATLGSLSLSNVTLDEAFDSDTITYTASVANTVTSTTVTAETTDSNATTVIKLDGAEDTDGTVDLAVGDNIITVEVTAEDTTTTETYTVTVTRAASISTDATLMSLSLSEGALTPGFDSDTTIYTANVTNDVSSITVTAATADPSATVVIKKGSTEATGGTVTLDVGSNTITVEVTAEDTSTTKTYTVTVTRKTRRPPTPHRSSAALRPPARCRRTVAAGRTSGRR